MNNTKLDYLYLTFKSKFDMTSGFQSEIAFIYTILSLL